MDEKLILEVSQITSYIKEMMDGDGLLTGLCIRGELSNYKTYPSGHHYFTLKDSKSSLSCVMFRSNALRLRFRPENGMTVVAAGRITVYERDGKYQLYCVSMSPEGAGDLAVAFEQLKKKLFNEGLFDESHKKPIPRFPHRIALITSSAGAALFESWHTDTRWQKSSFCRSVFKERKLPQRLQQRWTLQIDTVWQILLLPDGAEALWKTFGLSMKKLLPEPFIGQKSR